ncbi:MAG: hypothetical protein RID53_10190 [Coleofasciculus sp. B1-GNL1-01]
MCDRYQFKQKLGDNPWRQIWLADDITLSLPQSVIVKLLTVGKYLCYGYI